MDEYKTRSREGSALVTTVIILIFMGVVMASFLDLTVTNSRLAKVDQMNAIAFNLAENGADEAVYAIREEDWDTWTEISNGIFRKEITDIDLGNGMVGTTTIFLDNRFQNTPYLLSEGRVTHGAFASDSTRQIFIRMKRSSLFANGLTSRGNISFRGNNVEVDSYHSARGPYDRFLNRGDRGTVGSLSSLGNQVSIQNANVLGYVQTGGGDPSIGAQGRVRGKDTPDEVRIDEGRISRDFYTEFPNVQIPTLVNPQTAIGSFTTPPKN